MEYDCVAPNKYIYYDIETDSLDKTNAKVKFFAYCLDDDEPNIIEVKGEEQIDEIRKLFSNSLISIGFNNHDFDDIILKNNGINVPLNTIDLYVSCKAQGKLKLLKVEPKDFTLRAIAEKLQFEVQKGDIDYNIFKQENFTAEDLDLINKYAKIDVLVTRNLFLFLKAKLQPLSNLMTPYYNRKETAVRSSPASIAATIICTQVLEMPEWNDNEDAPEQSIKGGLHITPSEELVKGNIIYLDFTSAYPNTIIQHNLLSPNCTCCDEKHTTNEYFVLEGSYCKKTLGRYEQVLQKVFQMRMEAKKNNDDVTASVLKLIVNSIYGAMGCYKFKTFYNPTAAGDCTRICRTLLENTTHRLEQIGCKILGGFTDGFWVYLPEDVTEKEAIYVANCEQEYSKKFCSFPQDNFVMAVDKKAKMLWNLKKGNGEYAKNNYFYVTLDNKLEKKGGAIITKNSSLALKRLYEKYIAPKIIRTLEVNFTVNELKLQLIEVIKEDFSNAAQTHNSKEESSYKIQTSLPCCVSRRYGVGKHQLIPNNAGVGVGSSKGTKNKKPIRHCTIEEFREANLTIKDISLDTILKKVKPFVLQKITNETLIIDPFVICSNLSQDIYVNNEGIKELQL